VAKDIQLRQLLLVEFAQPALQLGSAFQACLLSAPEGRDPGLPLLGLAGEVGSLVTEYKKKLCGGESYTGFHLEVSDDLGDLLWYTATLARTLGLSLNRIADADLTKTASMWGQELPPPRQYARALLGSSSSPQAVHDAPL
jgi:hypothetical protein